MVADVLDLPALTHARQITVDGTSVRVRRETDRGAVMLTADLPAVISVSEKINEPRYPSFKGIMAAVQATATTAHPVITVRPGRPRSSRSPTSA